jgi:hypothetical protein
MVAAAGTCSVPVGGTLQPADWSVIFPLIPSGLSRHRSYYRKDQGGDHSGSLSASVPTRPLRPNSR